MGIWNIQFVVSPPFEHPHQQGFIVHVEIEDDASGTQSSRFWRREYQGMEWMQNPPLEQLRLGTPTQLSVDVADIILKLIRSASVCLAAEGDFGYIHPTKYQLSIQSGFNSCSIKWVHQLPKEWSQFQQVIEIFEAIGNNVENSA